MSRPGALGLSTYALKPRFQSLLRPLVRRLARGGVHANHVTVVAATLSILVGSIAAWDVPDTRAFLLIPLWLLVRMALNAIDGMLAREFGQESRLGFYLNELGDVASDVALYLPFASVSSFTPALVVMAVVLAVVSEYAAMLRVAAGEARRNDGPMGKSDRAFAFGALGLWVGIGSPAAAFGDVAIALIVIALGITIVNRVRGALIRQPVR